jgi:hypothetical protein
MARRRSDRTTYLGGLLGIAVAGAVIFAVVDTAMVDKAVDTNSSNATTSGPPAAFETPAP